MYFWAFHRIRQHEFQSFIVSYTTRKWSDTKYCKLKSDSIIIANDNDSQYWCSIWVLEPFLSESVLDGSHYWLGISLSVSHQQVIRNHISAYYISNISNIVGLLAWPLRGKSLSGIDMNTWYTCYYNLKSSFFRAKLTLWIHGIHVTLT